MPTQIETLLLQDMRSWNDFSPNISRVQANSSHSPCAAAPPSHTPPTPTCPPPISTQCHFHRRSCCGCNFLSVDVISWHSESGLTACVEAKGPSACLEKQRWRHFAFGERGQNTKMLSKCDIFCIIINVQLSSIPLFNNADWWCFKYFQWYGFQIEP